MVKLVIAIIFVVVGLGAVGVAVFAKNLASAGVGAVLMILGVLIAVFSSVASVGTQDIGVETSYGHVDGYLNAGLHWKAPWKTVTTLDDRIQTNTYASPVILNSGTVSQGSSSGSNSTTTDFNTVANGASGPCIEVRIARQATACVNVTVRWQLDDSGVDYLYRNYQTNANIQTNLLHKDLQDAVDTAFAGYDPLDFNANGDSQAPSPNVLAGKVQSALVADVGSYLDIKNVIIPIFNFDPATQSRLNSVQTQAAQTKIAVQQQATNKALAKANNILSASLKKSGQGVLESKCLDILNDVVQSGGTLPNGFSCFPGGAAGVAVTSNNG